jgi:hypothetical protein
VGGAVDDDANPGKFVAELALESGGVPFGLFEGGEFVLEVAVRGFDNDGEICDHVLLLRRIG